MKKKTTKPHKKTIKRQEQLRTIANKKVMLKQLVINLGNVTKSCNETGINRTTYYDWLERDKDFKEKVDAIPEIRLDHYEAQLNKLIDEGNVAAVIFALKSQGKKRNWVERQEIDGVIRDNRLTAAQFSEAWKEINEGEKCKSRKNSKKS